MASERHRLGQWGETEAARHLEANGLRIVERRYRQPWGEIDLIAREGRTWVFVEVKTRSSLQAITALEAVTVAKRRRVQRAALSYMKARRLEGEAFRFDVVVIERGRLDWIRNAFEGFSDYTY